MKRMISTEDVSKALRYVGEFSSPARPVVLVGGVAMSIYGSDRLTGDIDVLSSARFGTDLRVEKRLSFGGWQFRTPEGITVDVIVRQDRWKKLYRDALRHPGPRHVAPGVGIVRPEYLIAMKMVAGRPKDEHDVLFLLSRPRTDLNAVRKVVEQHLGPYAVDEVEQLAREARWRKREGKL